MTAKEYLGRIKQIDRRVEMLTERAERARARLVRVTSLYGSAPGGGHGDWTDALAGLIDEEDSLAEQLRLLTDERSAIMHAIEAVPDEQMRLLLQLRYVDLLSQTQTAARLYCDRRTVQRWEEKALACIHPPQDEETL